MAHAHDLDDDDLLLEEVERRTEPRGFFTGMTAIVTAGPLAGTTYEVVEASRRGLFMKLDQPDALALGTAFRLEVRHRDKVFTCDFSVARKEVAPRKGVAGPITPLGDADRATLEAMLASASAGGD
jgi:hypothetical protein